MRNLFTIGFLLIIIGFAALFIGTIIYASQQSSSVSGGLVVTIFFIPIVGSFGKYGDVITLFLIILTIILIVLTFIPLILLRRKVEEKH